MMVRLSIFLIYQFRPALCYLYRGITLTVIGLTKHITVNNLNSL